MSDKTNMIGEITEETIDAIKKRSAFALPDNPSASGMKPSEIKKAFWAPIISNFGSICTELARVIEEANASLDALDEEDKRIAADMLEKLSLAQSNFQAALEAHDTSDVSHTDIRNWLSELQELTETVKTWEDERGALPPAFSLVKSFYEKFLDEMNKLLPMASGSINNIKYDADAGDLILYFNNSASLRVELPLERLVGEGYYDEESRTIRLSLDDGGELVIPVGDLVDEYEGDGETVEVYREGGVRKIRILPAFIEKRDETVKALGEAIDGLGAAMDGIETDLEGIRATANENEERITDIETEMGKTYELLYDETIAEGTERYERLINQDKDGQPLNLSAFYMVINFPVSDAEKTIDGHVGAYNAQGTGNSIHLINLWTSKVTSTTAAKYFFVSGRYANGVWYDVWKSLQIQNNKDDSVSKVFGNHTSLVTNLNRSRMEFRIKFGNNSHFFDVGTRIRIFGVKLGGNDI